jgi:amino acid transporter
MRHRPTTTTPTSTPEPEDGLLRRVGYWPQFARTLGWGESFGLAFSFISVTTGIFTTFGFLLATAGPRGIWTWPLAVGGQTLVALVYATLAARVPLAGGAYQWATRLAGPLAGWWLGWLSLSFLVIVTVSVDYALIQTAVWPLAGLAATPATLAAGTLAVIATQAALLCWSTPATARLNNLAVLAEIIGLLQLAIVLVVAGRIAGIGRWANLTSTAPIPAHGWWAWLGPGMLATLLGAYTIVGFEASATLAEETRQPTRVVPRAMVQAVIASGALGMLFLVALAQAIPHPGRIAGAAAPVAAILRDFLGGRIEPFLAFICLAIYTCGTVIMTTASRLAWAMARDRRLPAHQLLARVPRATGGPVYAVGAVAGASALIVATLGANPDALTTLFTASTLLPAILYTGTVALAVWAARHAPPTTRQAPFTLGAWQRPVTVGALGWLGYELLVLLAPARFRPAQAYALGAVALGALIYLLLRLAEPDAMTRQPTTEDLLTQNAASDQDTASFGEQAPW